MASRKKKESSGGLRGVRALADKTQVQVAEAMGTGQSEVSILEGRESLDGVRVDTLRRYAHALGGRLELVVVLGGKRHVIDP